MTNIICTGGYATRLGPLAPGGCKALTMVKGRPVLEWQLDVLGDAVIICRPDHQELLSGYGRCKTGMWSGVGPSIADTLHELADEPVTIIYGDTLLSEVPAGSDWVGVSDAPGGRSWDVVHPSPMVGVNQVYYDFVPETRTARVCVGVYSFADTPRVRGIFDFLQGMYAAEGRGWGMGRVLNHYRTLDWVDIPSWRDVGSVEAVMAVNERVFP